MLQGLFEPRRGVLGSEHPEPLSCSSIAKCRARKEREGAGSGSGGVWLLLGNHGHTSQAMDKT